MGRIVWIPTYRKQSPSPNPPGVTPKQKSRWYGNGHCGGYYGRYGDYYGGYGGYGSYGYYPGLFSYAEQRYPYV